MSRKVDIEVHRENSNARLLRTVFVRFVEKYRENQTNFKFCVIKHVAKYVITYMEILVNT